MDMDIETLAQEGKNILVYGKRRDDSIEFLFLDSINTARRSKMKRYTFLFFSVIFLPRLAFAGGLLKLPVLPSPENYGDIFMYREAEKKNVAPVVFSHWIHRVKYTCRVCHYELEFSMKSNDTPLVCNKGKMNGRFCAVCHNGKVSFGPEGEDGENCSRCHSRTGTASWNKFRELQEKLPKSKFGNEIDWSKALNEGFIKPANSLSGAAGEIVNIGTLMLRAEVSGISSAVFPHKTHEQWLDCSSCHPELFNIKNKTTESLRMINMIKSESCGVCHLFVAFPLDDCKKCHPNMRI
jgi:c(7)-type cytochrome triheme protein